MNVIVVLYVLSIVTLDAFMYNGYDAVTQDRRSLASSASSLSHSAFTRRWKPGPQEFRRNDRTEKSTLSSGDRLERKDCLRGRVERQLSNTYRDEPRGAKNVYNGLVNGNVLKEEDVVASAEDAADVRKYTEETARDFSNGGHGTYGKSRDEMLQKTLARNEGKSPDRLLVDGDIHGENLLKSVRFEDGRKQVRRRLAVDRESYPSTSNNVINIQQRQPVNERNLNDRHLDGSNEKDDIENFLKQVKKTVKSGKLQQLIESGYREGRRRKLNSEQQGTLLVEALRKKRNSTGDDRGHNSQLQNGIMDMLGRSTFSYLPMYNKSSMRVPFSFFSSVSFLLLVVSSIGVTKRVATILR